MSQPNYNIWWGPPKKFNLLVDKRKISWLELFYDLVYVIAISRATHLFAQHPGITGLVDYAYIFIMIFWGWVNGSLYHDLHGSPGIRTRFMTLWQMMAVSALVICLDSPPETMVYRTTIALIVLQLFITYLWWSVGFYDPSHRKYNKPYTICFLLAAVLLGSTFFAPEPWIRPLMWTALVLDFTPPFIATALLRRGNEDLSLSSAMVERLGLFTIIVFGECVLGVINGITQLPGLSARTWVNFGLAVLIVFSLWWIFFSIVADREGKKGFLNATLIELAYIPTLASLGIIGASFPGLFHHFENALRSEDEVTRLFFGSALFVFLAGITILSYLLNYPAEFEHAKKNVRQLLLAAGVSVLAFTMLFPDFSLSFYLGIVFTVLLIIVITITRIWFVIQMKILDTTE